MSPEKRPPDAQHSGHNDGFRVEGRSKGGRPCALVDRTGDAIPRSELENLLAQLVAADAFGFQLTGDAAGIAIRQARFAHVQIGECLYRLIVERDSARLEVF